MQRIGVLRFHQAIFMYEFGDLYVDVLKGFVSQGVSIPLLPECRITSVSKFRAGLQHQSVPKYLFNDNPQRRNGTSLGNETLTLEEALHCCNYRVPLDLLRKRSRAH